MLADSREFTLAVAQMGPVSRSDHRSSVITRMIEMMKMAHSQQADFVVYPELALTTFFPRQWFRTVSEVDQYFESAMPNPTVQPLFDTARHLGVGFYVGYAELTPEGTRFNSAIIVDRNGEIVSKYRKVHLPGHSEHRPVRKFQHLEKRYFEVGDLGFGVSDVGGIQVGMGLCNDRRWAETYRVLALEGADLAIFGYNTPAQNHNHDEPPHLKMFHNHLSIQAGAYQNSIWVASAAKSGVEDGQRLIGGSAIVAPTGEIVAQAYTEGDEVVTARVDLKLSDYLRESVFNFSAHRRVEHYKPIVERVGRREP